MKCYDQIDPGYYERRYEVIPCQRYSKNHWRQLVIETIGRYCKNKIVLDLGCGTGIYTRLIKKHTRTVLGLDISRRWLDYAKSREGDLNLLYADAHHVPVKRESVDVILAIGLFEYVDREVVTKQIYETLGKGGVCIILVPNKYSAHRAPGKLAFKILGREYTAREPSRGEMLKLLRGVGFEITEHKMDDGLIFLPDSLDRLFGEQVYLSIERFFRLFSRNPFSNNMLFVVTKK